MVKQHLKRLASPKTWPIPKKKLTFVARPFPGPHKMIHQIAISVFLRDVVKLAKTQKEVKKILHDKLCLIDGSVVHDNKRPVGLMDAVSLPKINKFFRIGINKNNNLIAIDITEKEASEKISKIMSKNSLRGGKTQINTLDGRCFIVEDAKKYSVGDSLLVNIPEQKIKDHLIMEKGVTIFLDAGKHVGVIGEVKEIEGTTITVLADDLEFRTKKRYAIVVGKDKALLKLNE